MATIWDYCDPLKALHSYWRQRANNGRLPRRSDIDPLDMPDLLQDVALIDIEEDRPAKFRLVGTRIGSRLGCDYTGQRISGLKNRILVDYLHGLYQTAACKRCAYWSDAVLSLRNRKDQSNWQIELNTAQVVLPLARDRGIVDMLLIGWSFALPLMAAPQQNPVEDELTNLVEAARIPLN